MNFLKLFYFFKPFIPRRLQLIARRLFVLRKRASVIHVWPIDQAVSPPPEDFKGWLSGKKFAFLLTHDVETIKGLKRCEELLAIDLELGFLSSFNFVPLRYRVPSSLRHKLVRNGLEVGVHGLKHDGKLYNSYKTFSRRASQINRFLEDWNAVGFRSPSMHHNLEWLHKLNIQYDSSTFDTDPFEPQSDGVRKIFPFWFQGDKSEKGYIEMPYTMAQDFTLFILLKEKNIDIWIKKLDWLAEKGGMALVGIHPDYLAFGNHNTASEEYPIQLYKDLLLYVKEKYRDQYWNPTPRILADFWKREVCKIKD